MLASLPAQDDNVSTGITGRPSDRDPEGLYIGPAEKYNGVVSS